MAVFVIDSDIEGFKTFCDKLAEMVDLNFVSSFQEALGDASKNDVIVNVLDGNQSFDKAILQFRKVNLDLKIIGFYHSSPEEDIVKHSGSEFAADIYITADVSEKELASNLKELGLSPQFFSEETKTLALEIVQEHVMEKTLTESAKAISEKLNKVFLAAIPDDYKANQKIKEIKNEKITELSIENEVVMNDEIDLEMTDNDIELGSGGEDTVAEVNPGEVDLDIEEDQSIEFAVNDEEIVNEEVAPNEFDLASQQDGMDIDLVEELSFGAEETLDNDEPSDEPSDEATNKVVAEDEIQLFDDDSPSQLLNLSDATGIEGLNLGQTETESVLDSIKFGIDAEESENDSKIEHDEELDMSLSDLNLSEVDKDTTNDLDEYIDDTATIQGLKMTSSEDLKSDDEEIDQNPLDDIKTKMLEIDKLLLANDEQDISMSEDDSECGRTNVEEGFSLDEDSSLISEDRDVIDHITSIKEALIDDQALGFTESSQEIESSTQRQKKVSEHREFQRSHEDELIRLGETINSLRQDRESLLERIMTLEGAQNAEKKDFLSLRAELDEKKIEIGIIKKRYSEQIEDLNIKLDLVENKKEVLSEKNKRFQEEFEKLKLHNKTDLSKVRYRERELEQQLELLRGDAEVQVQNRDHKILELKRRIDTLEFDIENSQFNERKSVDDQGQLEEKMNKVIKTLRTAIGDLEGETPTNIRERLIKKNLDV